MSTDRIYKMDDMLHIKIIAVRSAVCQCSLKRVILEAFMVDHEKTPPPRVYSSLCSVFLRNQAKRGTNARRILRTISSLSLCSTHFPQDWGDHTHSIESPPGFQE